MGREVLCGADRIHEYGSLFYGKRLGLITNPTGLRKDLSSTADYLAGGYSLKAMYAPEHGVRGDRQDGQDIQSYMDKNTGVQVFSIYGERRAPSDEMLDGIDLMIYDIQDVGSRYYTYIYSKANCMEACGRLGIPFVVLDRPNPISGLWPEGTHMEDHCRSFIGMYDFPQRYALTCGELARLINERFGIGVSLTVIPMKGWSRDMMWFQTGLTWVSPSPNMPTPEAALLYNGTGMFEGTTLSEGRGTTHPFEIIGAPWLDAGYFARALEERKCPGVRFRPVSFIPMFHKHAGILCHGVQVHVTDWFKVRPVELGVNMVLVAEEQSGRYFSFTPPKHEVGDYTMDLLFGSPGMRREGVSPEEIGQKIRRDTGDYVKYWKDYWEYGCEELRSVKTGN